MMSNPFISARPWFERVGLIGLTSLFHHFPMPTFIGVSLMVVVGVALKKPPMEYRNW